MNKNILSDSNGVEGNNISASAEQSCGEKLLKELPKGWKIRFHWCQILFSDVQYEIIKKKKMIDIAYNQNLGYWWGELMKEVVSKIK